MASIIDRTGIRYGKLTVIKIAKHRGVGKMQRVFWLCRCDCGEYKEASASSLQVGENQSCGCLLRIKDRKEAMFRYLYSCIKNRNKNKLGETELITFERFVNLSKSACFYCGLENSKFIQDRTYKKIGKDLRSDETMFVNGIDRLDSSIGYKDSNVVACCKFCNSAKNTMSQIEFMNWVKRVYEYNYNGK